MSNLSISSVLTQRIHFLSKSAVNTLLNGRFPFILGFFLLGLLVQPASSQGYALSPLSQLQIEGTSSVNSFTCTAGRISGEGVIQNLIKSAGSASNNVVITVPIGKLDCQNHRMNRDLRDALKSDDHPNIVFRLTQVEVLDFLNSAKGTRQILTTGNLSLAGVTRSVSVLVEGYFDEWNKLHGQGSVAMKMTDFGVTPPSALLGLVKAHNEITIRFHLIAVSDLQ